MKESFEVKKYSDVGSGEPFMARLTLGLTDILDVTGFDDKEEINEAILNMVFNGVLPSFLSLREIRNIEAERVEKIVATLNKNYQDFYRHLWAAYKDKMQTVTRLLGYNLGFLFQKQEAFREGSKTFLRQHPEIHEDFVKMLLDERQSWQKVLSTIRNDHLEHQKGNSSDVDNFFKLPFIELMFQNCWQAIEEILVLLLKTRLPDKIHLSEIPEDDRDKECPKRYCFVVSNLE